LLILAHRGTGPGRSENTIASFEKGLQAGAEGIEFDVRITSDGVVICSHDDNLNRVFGIDMRVNEFDFETLQDKCLLKGSKLLKAKEVFERFNNKIFYNIEVKDPEAINGLIGLIENFKISDFMVSSFNHECLKLAKEILPKVNIATLINSKKLTDYQKNVEAIIESYKPHSVNLDIRIFLKDTDEKVTYFSKLRDKGLKFAFWTVNQISDFLPIKELCDYLITDVPELFQEYKQT